MTVVGFLEVSRVKNGQVFNSLVLLTVITKTWCRLLSRQGVWSSHWLQHCDRLLATGGSVFDSFYVIYWSPTLCPFDNTSACCFVCTFHYRSISIGLFVFCIYYSFLFFSFLFFKCMNNYKYSVEICIWFFVG